MFKRRTKPPKKFYRSLPFCGKTFGPIPVKFRIVKQQLVKFRIVKQQLVKLRIVNQQLVKFRIVKQQLVNEDIYEK